MANLYTLQGSEPAMTAESNLFSVPATLSDKYRVEEERIGPTAAITEDLPALGDITFFIPASSHGLIALPELCFELELAIKKKKPTDAHWSKIDDTDKVAPVNFIAHSLFQSCQVSLCNRTVSDTASYYPYRAMFEALTTYGNEAATSQLTSAGFYLDSAGHHEEHEGNTGVKKRRKLFVDNEYVQLSGKVYSDVTSQEKSLVTGVPVGIRFAMNKPEFYLRNFTDPAQAHDVAKTYEYRAFIRNPKIFLKRYIGTPDFMNAVAKQLLTTSAKYHLEKQLLRVNDISRGTQSTVLANLHHGQLPKMLVCAFVDSETFHGSKSTNPFKFKNYGITQISVEVDGISYPTKPYQLDFDKSRTLEAYDGLLDVLGRKHALNGALMFDRSQYEKGYTLFAFSLSPSGAGRGELGLIKQGNLSLALTFSAGLPNTVMCVSMLYFDSILEIDHFRNLITDFSG